MFSSWFTFTKWTHKATYVHALDVRVENYKILQFFGRNIRWYRWRSSISLQILNVHECLHSRTFILWTYVDVRLRLLQHLDVRVRMAKERRCWRPATTTVENDEIRGVREGPWTVNMSPVFQILVSSPSPGQPRSLRIRRSFAILTRTSSGWMFVNVFIVVYVQEMDAQRPICSCIG